MAWQGIGMGAAWERHGMCELVLLSFIRAKCLTPLFMLDMINPMIFYEQYLSQSTYRVVFSSLLLHGPY
jgi:hypothetical protein